MRDPQVDQPRLLAPGDDLDRVAERDFGLGDEFAGIAGDAQRRGADAADRLGREPAQALAETVQARQRRAWVASSSACRPRPPARRTVSFSESSG
jgi:hypothetical protein